MKKDYIIVGLGIAGISMCEQLKKNGKSFIVFDCVELGATANSGGVFNPTVLKRFTAVWKAAEFYPKALSFYNDLSEKLKINFFEKTPVMRIFKNVEEQNNWSVASDKNELRQFLSSDFIKNTNSEIEAPFGFGKVMGTAQINAGELLTGYQNYLKSEGFLISENFQYELISDEVGGIRYKAISAKKIIFTEGAKVIKNPFFPKSAIIGNKGEYVIVKSPKLKLNFLLKGPVYVIPLGNDTYKVGATYSRDDYSFNTTSGAKTEILSKLKTFIKCDFEVIGQSSGIRPTTKDRRPLLGSLIKNPNLVFFNGLGSRGFLMAPLLSEMLYGFLEENKVLPSEVDIQRINADN